VGGIAYLLFRLRYEGLRNSRTRSAAAPIRNGGDGATVGQSNTRTGR
jgi:hypothetical protein